jgi:membrane protein YqaA with SNARE-associated domain
MNLASLGRWVIEFSYQYGYFGVFVTSFVGAASIFFPVPSFVAVTLLGAILNPFLVGVAAGIGAGLGELTGYILGYGSRKKFDDKYKVKLEKGREYFHKYGGFTVIFAFAATPLPDDFIGIFAGVIGYDWKKFAIASILGKSLLHITLAYGGLIGAGMLNLSF